MKATFRTKVVSKTGVGGFMNNHVRNWLVSACLSLAVGAGCGAPRLIDYKPTRSDAEYRQQVFSSPIVVVGVIESDTLVNNRVPSHWDRQALLQFRKLKIRVENVLRGDSVPTTATVYYFTWAGGFNGPRPLGFWTAEGSSTPTKRRVFWLKSDSGVLRTACDGWDECTMPVASGAHPNYKPEAGKPLGYALADIMFTRGEGATDAEFAAQLEWGAPSTIPEAYLIEKVKQLAATDIPVVQAAACELLSHYRQGCAAQNNPVQVVNGVRVVDGKAIPAKK